MLSIIIVTFNSIEYIRPCLDSLFVKDYKDLEVIIVDSGSRDGTLDYIKSQHPQVALIENKKNYGACRARNQGIEASHGDWVLTLDCDVVLEEDFFSKILKIIKDLSPEIGMFQPKILRPDKKTIYSSGIYLSRIRRFYDIGKGKIDSWEFNESKYIFGASSACALYNRRMLQDLKEDTGYFDERFFFLAEDVDLAWRAQRRGWKGIFFPEAVCYHSGNSSNTSGSIRQYLCFRNRYLMIRKNTSLLGRVGLFVLSSWYEASRFLYLLFTNKYTVKGLGGMIYES